MGKSAKFYKRPTKKEKETLALKKLVTPEPGITKKPAAKKKTTTISKDSPIDPATTAMDIDAAPQKVQKATKVAKIAQPQKSDYVDLLFGKKTHKKIANKI